ncbi:MAG: NnrS family protein [Magnetococcales bacterium]|nr:NnrS family protein [Magnetococcales bacterium]NGZ05001.1 NnrS family protein [Magnetococcales bacterium]
MTAPAPIRMLLVQGFRGFFTLAGIWSVVAMVAWLAWLTGWLPAVTTPWPASQAHGHEMMFGFVGAAAAGFLLSATPVWSKTPPLTGTPLTVLVIAWLAGRMAAAGFGYLTPWIQTLADTLFWSGLLIFLTPTLWFTGNPVHRIFPILVGLMALGDWLMHLEAVGWHSTASEGLMLGVNAIVFFLAMTGGHIMPMFTRDALRARGEETPFPISPALEILGVTTLTALVAADLFFPSTNAAGWIFLAAGLVQGVRLSRWHGHKTFSTPLLWVLHLGYLWLVVGLLLRALAQLTDLVNPSAALHAVTIGAMGLFTLGIMARVALMHTGRALHLHAATLTTAFLLMTAAAVTRVFGTTWAGSEALLPSGGLWIGAYLLFCWLFVPILSTPRPDGQAG